MTNPRYEAGSEMFAMHAQLLNIRTIALKPNAKKVFWAGWMAAAFGCIVKDLGPDEFGDVLNTVLDALETLTNDAEALLAEKQLRAAGAVVEEEPATTAPDVATAFDVIKGSMHADPEYAWSWHCNAATASLDEGIAHAPANRAAARFMYAVFGLDTSKHPNFLVDEAKLSPLLGYADRLDSVATWMDSHVDLAGDDTPCTEFDHELNERATEVGQISRALRESVS